MAQSHACMYNIPIFINCTSAAREVMYCNSMLLQYIAILAIHVVFVYWNMAIPVHIFNIANIAIAMLPRYIPGILEYTGLHILQYSSTCARTRVRTRVDM